MDKISRKIFLHWLGPQAVVSPTMPVTKLGMGIQSPSQTLIAPLEVVVEVVVVEVVVVEGVVVEGVVVEYQLS